MFSVNTRWVPETREMKYLDENEIMMNEDLGDPENETLVYPSELLDVYNRIHNSHLIMSGSARTSGSEGSGDFNNPKNSHSLSSTDSSDRQQLPPPL